MAFYLEGVNRYHSDPILRQGFVQMYAAHAIVVGSSKGRGTRRSSHICKTRKPSLSRFLPAAR